jgi:hypothetical protein
VFVKGWTYSLLLIGFFRSFSLLNHIVNFFLGQTSRWLNSDGLFLSGGLVLGTDLHDTVVIDFISDFDLWNTSKFELKK